MEQQVQEKKPQTQKPSGKLLRAQLVMAGLIFLALAGMKKGAPELFAQVIQPYRDYMAEQQYDAAPLVRFASAWVEKAFQTGEEGGSGSAQKPWNYAEETIQPEQELSSPLEKLEVTSAYGWRDNPTDAGKDFHTGLDLRAAEGTPVTAAAQGMVVKAAWGKSYGNYLLLAHPNHTMTLYAHMQYLFVRTGQPVEAGQTLGTSGKTGNVTGPHLHFELFYKEIGYDPREALGL